MTRWSNYVGCLRVQFKKLVITSKALNRGLWAASKGWNHPWGLGPRPSQFTLFPPPHHLWPSSPFPPPYFTVLHAPSSHLSCFQISSPLFPLVLSFLPSCWCCHHITPGALALIFKYPSNPEELQWPGVGWGKTVCRPDWRFPWAVVCPPLPYAGL